MTCFQMSTVLLKEKKHCFDKKLLKCVLGSYVAWDTGTAFKRGVCVCVCVFRFSEVEMLSRCQQWLCY